MIHRWDKSSYRSYTCLCAATCPVQPSTTHKWKTKFSAAKSRGQRSDLKHTAELGWPYTEQISLNSPINRDSIDAGIPPAGPLSSPSWCPLTIWILAGSCWTGWDSNRVWPALEHRTDWKNVIHPCFIGLEKQSWVYESFAVCWGAEVYT